MSFSRWLTRVKLFDLVGVAGVVGVVTGVTGYFAVKKRQRHLLSLPFVQQAMRLFDSNSRAQQLLGPPIEVGYLNPSAPDAVMTPTEARLAIPLTGKSLSGSLVVQASRPTPDAEWRVQRLDLVPASDSHLHGKSFLIFKAS